MDTRFTYQPGMTVYGSDGEKVGTLQEIFGDYIVVEKGFFFPKDYYIPTSAVARAAGDDVYLTDTKDEALHQGWDTVPETETISTGAAYAGRGDRAAEDTVIEAPVGGERVGGTIRREEVRVDDQTIPTDAAEFDQRDTPR